MNLTMTTGAERVVLHVLGQFPQCAQIEQQSLFDYLSDLRPLLSDLSFPSDEDLEVSSDSLSAAVHDAAAAFDWTSDDDQAIAVAQLVRGCAVLCDLGARGAAVQKVLVETANRIPEQGYDPVTLGRLWRLARELPMAAMREVVVPLPVSDWSSFENALALLRLKTGANEIALDRGEEQVVEIPYGDMKQAALRGGYSDARAALVSWFNCDPPFSQVKDLAESLFSFRSVEPNAALGAWAGRRTANERTEVALALFGRGMPLKNAMSEVSRRGIDQARLATAGSKLIRKATSVSDRQRYAETLSGIYFTDPDAREQVVALLKWLLGPKRPQGDEEVFGSLLLSLAPIPLASPEKLHAAIDRARNRKKAKLRLTQEQGRRLHSLGIEVESSWFGSGTAKALGKWISQLPRI